MPPVSWASLPAMPACSFSQMRGTPKNTVGRTSLRLSATLSIDSAKYTEAPLVIGMWMVPVCSAMCDSGRYDRLTSSSAPAPMVTSSCAVHARLPCDSITPLGGPVVPEV